MTMDPLLAIPLFILIVFGAVPLCWGLAVAALMLAAYPYRRHKCKAKEKADG